MNLAWATKVHTHIRQSSLAVRFNAEAQMEMYLDEILGNLRNPDIGRVRVVQVKGTVWEVVADHNWYPSEIQLLPEDMTEGEFKAIAYDCHKTWEGTGNTRLSALRSLVEAMVKDGTLKGTSL